MSMSLMGSLPGRGNEVLVTRLFLGMAAVLSPLRLGTKTAQGAQAPEGTRLLLCPCLPMLRLEPTPYPPYTKSSGTIINPA